MSWAVVYLCRAVNGDDVAAQFVESYLRFPPGIDHHLVVIFKGFGSLPHPAIFQTIEHQRFETDDSGFDIGPYLAVARQRADVTGFCFVNSFTRPLAPDWLKHMVHALDTDSSLGMVGAMGSYERLDPQQKFPNIHIRSTGFCLRRELLLSLTLPTIHDKRDTNLFEAGPTSLSTQIKARGLNLAVVDRFGKAWQQDQWPFSQTFRLGEQEGLLMADRRSDAYLTSTPGERAWAASLAWSEKPLPHPKKARKLTYKFKKLLGLE